MATKLKIETLTRDLTNGAMRLMVLATIEREGPIHGYRLIQRLEETMEDSDGFKTGTLYPLLESSVEAGLIEGRWGPGPSGPQRRSYEITPKGRKMLKVATAEWGTWRDAVDRVLESYRNGHRG